MIVLGVDPGTAATGYGVVERPDAGRHRLVECGVIRPPPRLSLAGKLDLIFAELEHLIGRHRPEAVAVENVFVARNARSALVLGHARGVVLLAAARAGLDTFDYAPRDVKAAVSGHGAATKIEIQRMVARLLRLKSVPQPSDAADGVAVALTHCMRARCSRAPRRASA